MQNEDLYNVRAEDFEVITYFGLGPTGGVRIYGFLLPLWYTACSVSNYQYFRNTLAD